MKTLKRRGLLFLLVLAMLVSVIPTAFAAGNESVKISAGSAVGKADETVRIKISVSQNQGISGAGLQLEYDKDALELVEITSDRGSEYFTSKTSSGKLSWTKGTDVVGSFTLATVSFRIRTETADGTYPVRVSLIDGKAKNLVNGDDECVSPEFTDGAVTVKSTSSEDDDSGRDHKNPATPNGDSGKGSRFSDVPSDRWSEPYIEYLASRGIVDGIGDGLFGPTRNVTRAQFVKMLAGVAGADVSGLRTTQFRDVKSGDWFAPYVAWASKEGIVNGVSADEFAPNACVTREQMAAMIYRYANSSGHTLPAKQAKRSFADEADFSSYAVDAIYAMQRSGIINGKANDRFAPKDYTTREEAAKMLALTHQLIFG